MAGHPRIPILMLSWIGPLHAVYGAG